MAAPTFPGNPEIKIHDIYLAINPYGWRDNYHVFTSANQYATRQDEYDTWDAAIAAGHSYLVGLQKTREDYLRHNTSPVKGWMRVACEFAFWHPDLQVNVVGDRLSWVFRRRGEYVEIGLPHHDAGGERYWVTRNARSRVLVDVD